MQADQGDLLPPCSIIPCGPWPVIGLLCWSASRLPACRAFRAAQREKTMTIVCIILDSITTVAIYLTLRLSAAAYAWADAARWRRLKLRALDQRRRL